MQRIGYALYSLNILAGLAFASHAAYQKSYNALNPKDKRMTNHRIDTKQVIHSFKINLNKSSKNGMKPVKITVICSAVFFAALFATSFQTALLLAICTFVFISIMHNNKKKRMNELFHKNAYKLYRYLVSQINAGVKPKDAILNMYNICSDAALKKILVNASAAYSMTLDGNSYAKVLKSSIDSEDVARFCMILEQDLLYSDNENFLEKMEEMMFNRYFSYYKGKTDRIKKECFIAVCIFMLIVIIMTTLPLIHELLDGLKYIFQ